MGCTSERGFLGPKPRERQVYVDLIESIHDEAKTVALQQTDDPYSTIRDRIMKKGLLRKLIDNLISHKANLYECACQNYQIIAGSDISQQRIAGLVVIDKIISEFSREQKPNQLTSKEQSKSQIKLDIQPGLLQSFHSFGDFDRRVDSLYFNLIALLLEKQPTIQQKTLVSIYSFLGWRKDKLTCKNQVYRVLELLIKVIREERYIQDSTAAYGAVLNRLKDSARQENDIHNFNFFFRRLLKQEIETEQTMSNIEQILKQYFNRFYGHYEPLNYSILSILDELSFDDRPIDKLEKLLLQISQLTDTIWQFMKGFLIQLLKYLQINGQTSEHQLKFKNASNDQCKLNGFRLLTKWIEQEYVDINSLLEYNPSAIVLTYVSNIETANSVALQGELKHQFDKLLKFVSMQSLLIIMNLLREEIMDSTSSERKRNLLFSLFSELLKNKAKDLMADERYIAKVNFLINPEKYYSQKMNIDLLQFAKTGIQLLKINEGKTNIENKQAVRARICVFLYSIFEIISTIFAIGGEENQKLAERDINKLEKIHYLQRFISEVIQVLCFFADCQLYVCLLSFASKVNEFLSRFNASESEEQVITHYILLYLTESTIALINKKQALHQKFSEINLKLANSSKNHQNLSEITVLIRQFFAKLSDHTFNQFENMPALNKFNNTLTQRTEQNHAKIEAAKKQCKIQLSEWNEAIQIFKDHFRLPMGQDRQFEEQFRSESGFCKRASSLNVTKEEIVSEDYGSRHEAEQSFRDIIEQMQRQ